MKALIILVVFFTGGMLFFPPEIGTSQPVTTDATQQRIEQLKAKGKELDEKTKEAIKELAKPVPKIVYKTRTRTIKPKTITLYVRQPDGTITEHKVQSDGGFYIVELDSLAKENTHIEFKEDSSKLSTPKKNFLQKLFKRRGQ